MQKTSLIVVVILSLFAVNAYGAKVSVEGVYQGKSLYVQNPEGEEGIGFCATAAYVNGDPLIEGTSSSAFEIDFKQFNLQVGDYVFVEIEHEFGCTPKILNQEVLLPKSTFTVSEMSCTPNGKLSFTTTGEQGKLPFVVEQFRWNKWVSVGEIAGKGTAGSNSYSFDVSPHSGTNKVRVVQVDHTGKKRASNAVTFDSNVSVPSFSPIKVKKTLKFTAETKYEIYDAYGVIVKKGTNIEVDCSNLKKGAYYINYDNKNDKFIKM